MFEKENCLTNMNMKMEKFSNYNLTLYSHQRYHPNITQILPDITHIFPAYKPH